MTTQEHTARSVPPHGSNRRAKALLIPFRTAPRRWPVRSQLAKGKVAAENGDSRCAEPIGQCHEKRRVAVRSRAVSKDDAIPCRALRAVEVSPNAYFIYQEVKKLSVAVHTHRVLQPRGCVVFTYNPVCRKPADGALPYSRWDLKGGGRRDKCWRICATRCDASTRHCSAGGFIDSGTARSGRGADGGTPERVAARSGFPTMRNSVSTSQNV